MKESINIQKEFSQLPLLDKVNESVNILVNLSQELANYLKNVELTVFFEEEKALNRWELDEDEGFFDELTDCPQMKHVDKFGHYQELAVLSIEKGQIKAYSRLDEKVYTTTVHSHFFDIEELISLYNKIKA